MKHKKKMERKMQSKKPTLFLADESIECEPVIGVQLTDRISVPTSRTLTDAGQMHVSCKFARTGTQLYTAKQLGLQDVEPDKIITVYRDEKDVFCKDSLDSFRSAPVTIGHPKTEDGKPAKVSAENAKDIQVGVLEGMPVRDEDSLGGTLIITNKEAIDAIEEGTQELSAGYTCDVELSNGKYYQRNIRANHIAIVKSGRAGSSCRISDEADLLIEDQFEILSLQLEDANTKLEVSNKLVEDMKASILDYEKDSETLKASLADAELAAEQGVVERSNAMENARLIADMRDLGSKSVQEIERMVVEDQMPDKSLEGKGDAYISAMFEILVDASKGETPMGKLLQAQSIEDSKISKAPVDKVALARQNSIKRNSK